MPQSSVIADSVKKGHASEAGVAPADNDQYYDKSACNVGKAGDAASFSSPGAISSHFTILARMESARAELIAAEIGERAGQVAEFDAAVKAGEARCTTLQVSAAEDAADLQLCAPAMTRRQSSGAGSDKDAYFEEQRRNAGTQVQQDGGKLKTVLGETNGSSLKSWFKLFDTNQNGRIDWEEFQVGMAKLGYEGNVKALWNEFDEDGSGEITFDEVDKEESNLWNCFKRWCGSRFASGRDMIRQLRKAALSHSKGNVFHMHDEVVIEAEFVAAVRFKGWDQGFEEFLYSAIDVENEGCISSRDLKWLEPEIKRHKQKEEAKLYVRRRAHLKQRRQVGAASALDDFKKYLRQQYGSLFRAWRKCLDPDGDMVLQKADLFKVCRHLGWKGDVRALWKSLDSDGSGVTMLEELDPRGAILLAHFHQWATEQFGPKFSSSLWAAVDRQQRKKLKYDIFARECEALGYFKKAKQVANWLDKDDRKYLLYEDFTFLDKWKPPAWLTATPDPEGAEEFKKQMLKKYGHFLKAWRSVMDKDNSNCCNWYEFQSAAKHMRYSGDVAGVWLAFDSESRGHITLKDIDPRANDALLEFKLWADDEFGSVKTAFKVLDADRSGELNYREFRGACRNFGFSGDLRALFDSFDTGGEGTLLMKEVAFLDDWEVVGHTPGQCAQAKEEGAALVGQCSDQDAGLPTTNTVTYQSPSPGPGAYQLPSSFGAAPTIPAGKHGGSFSFTCRPAWLSLRRSVVPATVGPADYVLAVKPETARKPAWSIGPVVASRPSSAAHRGSGATTSPVLGQGQPSARRVPVPPPGPGPGSYELKLTSRGPLFSMRPRRPLVVPLQKEREKVFSTW